MLAIHLLGHPRLRRGVGESYQFRSRKSWALLAYLILGDHSPTRAQLAALLFPDADDPLRALRWSLTELRRGLGEDGTVDGDPVTLRLAPSTVVDVEVVARGAWANAVELPGLGADLLDGLVTRAGGGFASWLLSQQRRLRSASEAILHEAAHALMVRGDLSRARDLAVRATAMSPLDENHHALLIRLYRLAGDEMGARAQFDACVALLDAELGVAPGPAVDAALRSPSHQSLPADPIAIEAVIEAGAAAVSAGAVRAGLESLRTAVRLADTTSGDRTVRDRLRATSRLALAETLVRSVGGFDEEGLATLHEADRIATGIDAREEMARAWAEVGFVNYLRARYDRSQHWLAKAVAVGGPLVVMRATAYLGVVASDLAGYPEARHHLSSAIDVARAAGQPRIASYALAALGRVDLLCGHLDDAAERLTASIALAQREHWLSFLPWPQALLGEVHLQRGDTGAASDTTRQAFARACQIGDPCWEGLSARALGLVAAATGEVDHAFELLADAWTRCNRVADPYVWLSVYILDARCSLGRRHGHPATASWVESMLELAARTGMREFLVRAMVHRAALGHGGDAEAAAVLVADIDNPRLLSLLA